MEVWNVWNYSQNQVTYANVLFQIMRNKWEENMKIHQISECFSSFFVSCLLFEGQRNANSWKALVFLLSYSFGARSIYTNKSYADIMPYFMELGLWYMAYEK